MGRLMKALQKFFFLLLFSSVCFAQVNKIPEVEEALENEDYDLAISIVKQKSEAGDPIAQVQYGHWYQAGLKHKGQPIIAKDVDKAIEYYSLAIDQGYVNAEAKLGALYSFESRKEGVDEYDKAFKLFESAAKKGDTMGQRFLGWSYQYGHGVEPDSDAALSWYHKALDNGDDQKKMYLVVK